MTYIRGACYSSRLRVGCHRGCLSTVPRNVFNIPPGRFAWLSSSRLPQRFLDSRGNGWAKKKGATRFSVHNAPVPDGDDDTAASSTCGRRSYILVGGGSPRVVAAGRRCISQERLSRSRRSPHACRSYAFSHSGGRGERYRDG